MIEIVPRGQARWRSSDSALVVPETMARAMWRRAVRFDVGLGGQYLAERDTIQVWASGDGEAADPIGAFRFRWDCPTPDQATLAEISWDPSRSSEVEIRAAIRRLAHRLGNPTVRRGIQSRRGRSDSRAR